MAVVLCITCAHPKINEIDRRLLSGESPVQLGPEYGIRVETIRRHRRRHLPWIHRCTKKPRSVQEKMAFLEYRHEVLLALAHCGEKISEPLRVLQAERILLELEMRSAHLLESHRPTIPASKDSIEQGFEIVFENGKPKTTRRAHPTPEGKTREEIRIHSPNGSPKAEV